MLVFVIVCWLCVTKQKLTAIFSKISYANTMLVAVVIIIRGGKNCATEKIASLNIRLLLTETPHVHSTFIIPVYFSFSSKVGCFDFHCLSPRIHLLPNLRANMSIEGLLSGLWHWKQSFHCGSHRWFLSQTGPNAYCLCT